MAKRWSNEEIAAALKASAQEIKPKGKLPAKIEAMLKRGKKTKKERAR